MLVMKGSTNKINRRDALAASVAVGKDGFLFHRFEQTFEQICGPNLPNGRALERWVSLVESRHGWCADRGIPYYFFVVPEKHVVYEDKLNEGQVNEKRAALGILNSLNQIVRRDCIYPVKQLIEARKVQNTYLMTDTHWTSWGAFVGYRTLLETISRTHGMTPVAEKELRRNRFRMIGDLGIRLDPEVDEEAEALSYTGAQEYFRIFGYGAYESGQVEVFETNNQSAPKAVMFRDSQTSSFLQYLAPHFSRLVLVAGQEMFHELVRCENPDMVITQTGERQLYRPVSEDADAPMLFPTDFGERGFGDFTGLTLPLPDRSRDLVVSFGKTGNSAGYRTVGWSHQEASHVWMSGTESELNLPIVKLGCDHELIMDLFPALSPRVRSQPLEISANGFRVATLDVAHHNSVTINIPAELCSETPVLRLRLLHPNPLVPTTEGVGDDLRSLSIGVFSLSIRPMPGT
jgi:SGNH hydrolase-like domain, acetyltransferase AlgX